MRSTRLRRAARTPCSACSSARRLRAKLRSTSSRRRMRVCGGAAYRKDVGVERYFRDAQAANVMAPTTDQLYDFIGKAVCGLPLF